MYKVIVDHNPSQSDNDVVKEGLIKSYEAQFGERDKELSIFLKNDSGKVFGGIQAMFDSEAIYIKALWVEVLNDDKINDQSHQIKNLDAGRFLRVGVPNVLLALFIGGVTFLIGLYSLKIAASVLNWVIEGFSTRNA